MSKNKSLYEKLCHIFTPIDSFENLTDCPTETEVICRYIAIFDALKSKSYHTADIEKSAISQLASELFQIWEKHGVSNSKSQRSVEECLSRTFIPKFKRVFVKTPPKSEKLIEEKLKGFSDTFMSPAKRLRKESLNGKKLKNDNYLMPTDFKL